MNSQALPVLVSQGDIRAEVRGQLGLITLNRPQALNSLSLPMIRDLSAVLLHWQRDDAVAAVLVRGAGRDGKAPAFCAGGDIRFFHQAALAGDSRIEDFFSEEYALNHLIHRYPKPTIALMDGICMGGGMGIGQGAALRVVTERSKLAMPETHIGLFPDVGGGWFLSRLAGSMGEYLALTGAVLNAADAVAVGLADVQIASADMPVVAEALADQPIESAAAALATVKARGVDVGASQLASLQPAIDSHFSAPTLAAIFESLRADRSDFAQQTLATLSQRSPLMMAVTLELVHRARALSLAEDLRLERDLVRHCFALRPAARSETVEGIRALAIDKDHAPRWNPAHVEDIDPAELAAFFCSPWPPHAHPLRDLS